ncbi:MAG TPA: hypothetical protein VKU02_23695 [Gemmataceae bacterium]|nr:hypothetical protein [Gemmataceae bacterium]
MTARLQARPMTTNPASMVSTPISDELTRLPCDVWFTPCPAKEEERRQGCSRNPHYGAQQNSTWPTPLTGRAKHCLCWIQGPFDPG